ncbi:MAG TPA: DUF3891 family protein [Tepidisphaeraceae bacterium]|jgi:hypothetical protein
MIRKRVGDQFWLITQQDHARVAGVLARAVGNRQFAHPANPDVVYAAVDAHDDGWPLHDDAPTLNDAGLPADVFELPRSTEHPVWLESALRATRIDPYAGLLVSLHGLSLSAMAASMVQSDRPDDEHRRRQFDLNKIQHRLIEHAEGLRAALGLATDRPLRLGLADSWSTPAEEQLKFDFRLLQAVDALSLHVCCDRLPAGIVPQPHPRPGAAQVTLLVSHADDALHVRPWPFADGVVRVDVPYRAVSALAFADEERFRAAYHAAPVQTAHAELRAG